MTIKGLEPGKHTLLTYHNTLDSPDDKTFSDINIYVNGELIVENLSSTNRALSTYDAQSAYISFEAKKDTPVDFLFAPDYNSKASSLNVIINGLDGTGACAGRLDIFNNVVYNWGGRATDGEAHEVNFVNNYYKKGAGTKQLYLLNAQLEGAGTGSQSYFYSGNVMTEPNGVVVYDGTNNKEGRTYTLSGGQVLNWDVWVNEPFFESHAKIESASDAYKSVLSDVGCTLPIFDNHDVRVVTETLNGTYSCVGSKSGKPGFPDSQEDVGGYEDYPEITINLDEFDTDRDGLPNWWEEMFGLNPNSPEDDFSDSNADDDMDGYTNLEEYLHWMATPHYEVNPGETVEVDLAQYTRGFEKNPVIQSLKWIMVQ